MRFIAHGNKENKSLLLVHGMGNTSDLFNPILPYLHDYYVIVCELDGHSRLEYSTFETVEEECRNIEKYVNEYLGGRLYGILGYSLGGTIVTELISRGKIHVEKTILDSAFTVKMGIMTHPFNFLFMTAIWCIKNNIHIPAVFLESVMGKGNSAIVEDIYKGVTLESIKNAGLACYTYEIKGGLRNYHNPIVFWVGENETFPKKSSRLLKAYLPQMKRRTYKGMGHGQLLREHSAVYARRLVAFMASD